MATHVLDSAAAEQLEAVIKGEVITPAHPDYDEARKIFNGMIDRRMLIDAAGTFPVTTPLFAALLVSVVLIVGALTFFPALSLGPIVEHLLMGEGRVF